jgi:ADP-ribose pyrophosphatase YjhB (NUDIX family)
MKKSYGIACCRIPISTEPKPEILLIRRRYTWAFFRFIQGQYTPTDNVYMKTLFGKMTMDEKFDIASLNFSQMWYRVWANRVPENSITSHFRNQFHYFHKSFMADDGARLLYLLSQSISAEALWEIPKGRLKESLLGDEDPYNCAVREFEEETGIRKTQYKIFPQAQRRIIYWDDGCRYFCTYYIAIAESRSIFSSEPVQLCGTSSERSAQGTPGTGSISSMKSDFDELPDVPSKKNISPIISFQSNGQSDEVAEIKWLNIEQVRFIDPSGHLEQIIRPIFNFIKLHK